jgi:hypothetical protein
MIKKCLCCGSAEFVQVGDGNQLDVSHGICGNVLCGRIFDAWQKSEFLNHNYSLTEFAKQIFEERRRAKCD